MTAFLQDHGACSIGIVPVAAHKTVSHMEPAHIFHCHDRNHVADGSGVQKLFHLPVDRCVAEHMTDHNLAVTFLCHLHDLPALVKIRGYRLLQQQMIAFAKRRDGVSHMLPVLGGDHHRVRQLLLLQHLFYTIKTPLLRDMVQLLCNSYLLRINIRYGCDLHLLRVGGDGFCIYILTAASKTRDRKCNLLFHFVLTSLQTHIVKNACFYLFPISIIIKIFQIKSFSYHPVYLSYRPVFVPFV